MNKGQRCKVQGIRCKWQVAQCDLKQATHNFPLSTQNYILNLVPSAKSYTLFMPLVLYAISHTLFGPTASHVSRLSVHDLAVFSHRSQRKRNLHLRAFSLFTPKLNGPPVRFDNFLALVEANP